MPSSRKAREVDGFQVVRVVKHAKERAHEPAAKSPPPEPQSPPPPRQPGARIGHTAIPTRHEIMCYQCGYEFTVAGRVQTLYCPKCRTILEQSDITIDKQCAESIKTAGTIRLMKEGTLNGGELIARDVIVEGRVAAGRIRAFRTLELGVGAEFDETCLEGRDLRTQPGSVIKFTSATTYRHVDVGGSLDADLHASGVIRIRSTGCLRGEIHGAHLLVEEGAGLLAEVRISSS